MQRKLERQIGIHLYFAVCACTEHWRQLSSVEAQFAIAAEKLDSGSSEVHVGVAVIKTLFSGQFALNNGPFYGQRWGSFFQMRQPGPLSWVQLLSGLAYSTWEMRKGIFFFQLSIINVISNLNIMKKTLRSLGSFSIRHCWDSRQICVWHLIFRRIDA